ncbi:histone deacetylase 14, chloroplastic isoform X4 [Malus sylvestris]|uniref:histone deacetylase 14, chloroplastic isoform X4 n=1 Tax=Malus sylvestris TaxID=3752 RepID=UPI0021ACC2D3|nr:histone deacetylase 14, chloroplastic isoform X4 [Malus sylvestris]
MELLSFPISSSPTGRNALFLVRKHLCKWKSHSRFDLDAKFVRDRILNKSWRRRRCFSEKAETPISCSNGTGEDPFIPVNKKLSDARVIYAVAPAMGHNKEAHPESHFRVPAIVNALEKLELSPKFRGSNVIELETFKSASLDDIASVHTRAYVSGLEKAMDEASQQGIIFIEGSGPTYATVDTFQESLVAAGAGISLIDSVDGSYPGTGKFDEVGHGDGEGTTLNLPLPGGSGDAAMRAIFDEIIVPCAQRFKPDIILVSAGYDAHVLDPLASLQFTTGTYYMLASNIQQLAKDVCGGRCVFFLEGGYNLESLSYSVADSFRAFLGEPSLASEFDNPAFLHEEPSTRVRQAIQRVKQIHSL